MHRSPWSYYGHGSGGPETSPQRSAPDPTFGAERNVTRTREQLVRYLHRTIEEYSNIRAGERGYQKMIDEALKPPPRPESIEETLRRLAGERSDGSDPA